MKNNWKTLCKAAAPALVLFISVTLSYAGDDRYTSRVEISPIGFPVLSITNNYEHPITGLVMTVDLHGSNARTKNEVQSFFDVYVNDHSEKPIVKGGVQTMNVAYFESTPISELKPEIKAVVFADGTSVGEPEWINRILARRNRLYRQLTAVQETLIEAKRQHLRRDQVAADLERKRQDSEKINASNRDDRDIDTMVFRTVVHNLQGALRINGSVPNADEELYSSLATFLEDQLSKLRLANPSVDKQ